MAESLIVEPINFNVICILLDYNFRQVLIRITFKLYQLNAELKLAKGHVVFVEKTKYNPGYCHGQRVLM